MCWKMLCGFFLERLVWRECQTVINDLWSIITQVKLLLNSVHLRSFDYWASVSVLVAFLVGFELVFHIPYSIICGGLCLCGVFIVCVFVSESDRFWVAWPSEWPEMPTVGLSAFYVVTLFSRTLLNGLNTVIINWLFLKNSLSFENGITHPTHPCCIFTPPMTVCCHRCSSQERLVLVFPSGTVRSVHDQLEKGLKAAVQQGKLQCSCPENRVCWVPDTPAPSALQSQRLGHWYWTERKTKLFFVCLIPC